MLGVFVDMIIPLNLALLLIRAGFRVSRSAWPKRHTATKLQVQFQQRYITAKLL
jgi:hypothetical protein